MSSLILGLHVVVAIFLILVVLLQTGKGASLGAAFGGGSNTVFGSRGPASFLSKITTSAAVIFMTTSLTLSMLSSGLTKTTVVDEITQEAPPAPPMEAPEPTADFDPLKGAPEETETQDAPEQEKTE